MCLNTDHQAKARDCIPLLIFSVDVYEYMHICLHLLLNENLIFSPDSQHVKVIKSEVGPTFFATRVQNKLITENNKSTYQFYMDKKNIKKSQMI